MRLIAMLSFFDETDDMLEGSIRDLDRMGVTSVVAVDGRYDLLKSSDDEHQSATDSVMALDLTARACGLNLLLYRPNEAWLMNEVGKRQAMLRMTLSIAEPDDWLVIWDADYHLALTHASSIIERVLWTTSHDFADISFTDSPVLNDGSWYPMRMFMRAVPGMTMNTNHYTYLLPDGTASRILPRDGDGSPPSTDLSDVRVQHRTWDRATARRQQQIDYYLRRDAAGIES